MQPQQLLHLLGRSHAENSSGEFSYLGRAHLIWSHVSIFLGFDNNNEFILSVWIRNPNPIANAPVFFSSLSLSVSLSVSVSVSLCLSLVTHYRI